MDSNRRKTGEASLFSGGAWLIGANILENLGLLLVNLTLIRIYGPGNHGRFAYYLGLIFLLRLLMDAGICALLTKLLRQARRPDSEVMGLAVGIIAFLNLPVAMLIAFFPRLFTQDASGAFSWFAIFFLAMIIQNVAMSVFTGLRSMQSAFSVSMIFEAPKVFLILFMILARPDFESLLPIANLAYFLASLAVLALLAWTWKARGLKLPKPGPAAAMARQALVLWAPAAAIAVFPQASLVLLGNGLANRDVSYWATLLSWSMAGTVVLTPAATALFAWTAGKRVGAAARDVTAGDAGAQDAGDFGPLQEYHRLVVIAAVGAALALLAAGGWILRLYGPGFPQLKAAFGLLVLAQLADYPRFLTSPLLAAGRRSKANLVVETARVILALGAIAIATGSGQSLTIIAAGVLAVQLAFGFIRLAYIRKIREALPFNPFRAYVRAIAGGVCCLPFLAWDMSPALRIAGPLAAFAIFSGARLSDLGVLAAMAGRAGDGSSKWWKG